MIKIGKIGLFCGMSAAEEEKIISLAEQVAFNKGNVVIHEGDIGDALFVVRSGSVVVSKDVGNGLSEVLTSFESGEFFGEMALIDRSKRSATVTALETLQLLKFSGGRLDEFAVKEPEIFAKLYRNFATTLASHLRRSTEKLRLLAKESHDLKSTVNNITSEIVSVVSHELRTPVAVIKGAAEVLDDSSMTPDKQKNLLSIIQRHTLRLTGLFDDIAQLADMQMSGIQLEKSSGDIAALINDVVSELSDKAKQNDIKVETLFPSNLPKVPFHEKKMRRAVFHLIDNGIRYNKRGEKLIISARKDKSLTPPQLAISISDNGPGIPVEQREEMFKCFRQKTSSLDPNRASGLGVGLPLANSLINAHGGNLSLESSPQNGSTFTFTLPL